MAESLIRMGGPNGRPSPIFQRATFKIAGKMEHPELAIANIEANMSRDLPMIRKLEPANDRPAGIVGGGLSLAAAAPYLETFPGDLYALNDVPRWLYEREIGFAGAVYTDPQEMMRRCVIPGLKGVTHYVATCCHPALIEDLLTDGQDVVLFHNWLNIEGEPHSSPLLIGNGPTVGCRAVYLLIVKGHRDLHLFAMDGNLDAAGARMHAYGDDENHDRQKADKAILIQTRGGRTFATTTGLQNQTQFLTKIIGQLQGQIGFKIYGDGLLAAAVSDLLTARENPT